MNIGKSGEDVVYSGFITLDKDGVEELIELLQKWHDELQDL